MPPVACAPTPRWRCDGCYLSRYRHAPETRHSNRCRVDSAATARRVRSRCSPLAVAGLADPLVMRHVSALERARRVADITGQLSAVVEVTMEYLANQHSGKLRADRLELMEGLDLLGVDMRRWFLLNNGVALRLESGDHLNNQLKAMQFSLDLRF